MTSFLGVEVSIGVPARSPMVEESRREELKRRCHDRGFARARGERDQVGRSAGGMQRCNDESCRDLPIEVHA